MVLYYTKPFETGADKSLKIYLKFKELTRNSMVKVGSKKCCSENLGEVIGKFYSSIRMNPKTTKYGSQQFVIKG